MSQYHNIWPTKLREPIYTCLLRRRKNKCEKKKKRLIVCQKFLLKIVVYVNEILPTKFYFG